MSELVSVLAPTTPEERSAEQLRADLIGKAALHDMVGPVPQGSEADSDVVDAELLPMWQGTSREHLDIVDVFPSMATAAEEGSVVYTPQDKYSAYFDWASVAQDNPALLDKKSIRQEVISSGLATEDDLDRRQAMGRQLAADRQTQRAWAPKPFNATAVREELGHERQKRGRQLDRERAARDADHKRLFG